MILNKRVSKIGQFADYKPLNHIKVICSARRYKKTTLRACRFNCYSLNFPQHITIKQISTHLRSAVCRSTQLATLINSIVSQRDSRPASCIVGVDWLKVWVQLVVKGRDEQYRDGQFNIMSLRGFT